LTNKQKKFCDEYLLCLNATQAAIRAGYSEDTAAQTASRLMKDKDVQKYIESQKAKAQEEIEVSRKDIIKRLADIGFVEIDINKIKVADQIKALALIAEILGLNKPEAVPDNGILDKLLEACGDIR